MRLALGEQLYLADEGLSVAVYLALELARPLLLEGEAGVGKTEVARAAAAWLGSGLVRLQCYEGIDASQALYEWDYARQLLHLRALEAAGGLAVAEGRERVEDELYSERFLVRRPLLEALAGDGRAGKGRSGPERPVVLLIDELDRADDEFEAFLLEILSDWSVTVPELGTITAKSPPLTIITSNRTRDLHDALKRRCLYHWVEHPGFEREVEIVGLRAPLVPEALTRQAAAAAECLRSMELYKPPGVAETIDLASALHALGAGSIDESSINATLGSVCKYREDLEKVRSSGVAALVRRATARARGA